MWRTAKLILACLAVLALCAAPASAADDTKDEKETRFRVVLGGPRQQACARTIGGTTSPVSDRPAATTIPADLPEGCRLARPRSIRPADKPPERFTLHS
jgi:hypothetical protein